jgi:hypothetical protein
MNANFIVSAYRTPGVDSIYLVRNNGGIIALKDSVGGGGITDGDKGDITVSGSGSTWTIDNNSVTDAKLRQSVGLSVIGRSANSTGNVADIVAGTDHDVFRRSGTTLGFGKINIAGISATGTPDNTTYLRGDGTWSTVSGGVTTVANIGASPNAAGATISGSTLTLQPASASFGGVVTTGTQTFAGAKTMTDILTLRNMDGQSSVIFKNAGGFSSGIANNSQETQFFFGSNHRVTFNNSGAPTTSGTNEIMRISGSAVEPKTTLAMGTNIITHHASTGARQIWGTTGGFQGGVGYATNSAQNLQFFFGGNHWVSFNNSGAITTNGTNELLRLSSSGLVVNVPFSISSLSGLNTITFNTANGAKLILQTGGFGHGIGSAANSTQAMQFYVGSDHWFTWNNGGASSNNGVNEWMRLSGGNLGIGTTSPQARLDVSSTTSGFLPPRMTTAQQNAIASPAAGLQLYNTTLRQPHYRDNSTWQAVVGMTFGTAAPATTPTAVGNFFLDTTNKKLYVSTGTASSADWNILN